MENWLETHRSLVFPWHCDQFGHMNVRWYAHFFDDATFHMWPMSALRYQRFDELGAILVVVCDYDGCGPDVVDPVLRECNKPVFGGMFPRLIHGPSLLQQGMIVVGLPYAVDVKVVRGLSDQAADYEDAIDALPGVNEAAVIGVPHADLGEGLVAVICVTPGGALDSNSVIEALKASLAGFKVPRQIYTVDELPRNAMGKVQKNILRERYAQTFCI